MWMQVIQKTTTLTMMNLMGVDGMKNGSDNVYPITVDVKGLMKLFGIGRNTARRIGKEAGAVIRLGPRKTLYNVERVRQYLEQRMEGDPD